MKKSGVILLLIVAVACGVLTAENDNVVTGRVIDAVTRQPIAQTTIRVTGSAQIVTSDEKGEFMLVGLPDGPLTLEFSHVAYKRASREARAGAAAKLRLTVALEPVTIPVDGITVTASRFAEEEFGAPLSVSVTTDDEFLERNYATTAEVLREEPGLLVQKTTYGHGAPILRGLIGKHVLLLYDGIRLNKPTFRFGGNQYLNTVDLESVGRIEVAKGPSSVMFGSEAMGGAINLIPADVPRASGETLIRPSLVTHVSSADDGRSAHLELEIQGSDVSASLGGSVKKFSDLRGGGNIGKQTPTGWDEADFNGRVFLSLNQSSRMRVEYLGVRQDHVPRYDRYAGGEFEQSVYDPQDRDLVVVTYEAALSPTTPRYLKAGVTYQRELEGTTEQKTGSDKVTYSENKITSYGGYLQLSLQLHAKHRLSVGAEYYFDRVNSARTETTPKASESARPTFPDDSKYYSTGAYCQDEFSLGDALTATLGVRYSYYTMKSPLEQPFGDFNESYDDLTGSLSLSYLVRSNLNLIGRWSRGFRAPSLNDAVVLKFSSSGVDAPSTGLKPESSNNFEVGAKLRAERVDGSAFVFYDKLSDFIDRVHGTYDGKNFFDENDNGIQDEDEYDIFQRKNIAESRIYGFECEGHAQIGSHWELRGNCSWTWGENQTSHEPLSRIPPLMGLLGIRCNVEESFWVELFGRAAGAQRRLSERDLDDSRIDPDGTDGWATLNFRSRVRFEKLTATLTFENINDEAYKEHGSGIYSPGRNLMLTLAWQPLGD